MLESHPASIPPVGSNQRSPRWRTWLILLCALLALAIVDEVRTSRLQSSFLTRYAAQLTYDIGAGPSSRIVFPSSGPHDQQLGYSRLPEFTHRLLLRGYRIGEQAQMCRGDGAACRFGHRAAVSRKGDRRSRGPRCKRGGDVRRTARKTSLRALRGRAAAHRREPAFHRGPRTAGDRETAA